MMMGVGLLNPSDLPSEIAHTASNTPDRTKTSQAIRNIFPPSCLDLVRLPRPGVRADSGADYSKLCRSPAAQISFSVCPARLRSSSN